MLLALLTGQRVQTLHKLKVQDIIVKLHFSELLKTSKPGRHLQETVLFKYSLITTKIHSFV